MLLLSMSLQGKDNMYHSLLLNLTFYHLVDDKETLVCVFLGHIVTMGYIAHDYTLSNT
jgi:hypothetical protein